ncbi:MAG: hypothetical protein AAGI09_13120 [Pseudomonadota bacterium]
MKSVLPCLVLLIALGACAKPPSSIPATAVSTSNYDHHNCKELYSEMTENSQELSEAEERQRNAVAGDAVGVFLVLIPPSAFTGDASADVALHKGEDIAMKAAYARRCS